jgi:RNA polymerase sigma factor (sigma-70 family)
VQRPRECIESLERIQIAANQLREQLYASEMRLTFSDSSSASTDRALIDWGLETTTANAEALEHVLTRPQRAGPEARWRSVMRQSTQNGFYRWLRESVKGSVRDLGRPERKNRKRDQQIPLDDTDSAEILALLDDTGLPKRQQEVLLAVVAGETVADAARRLGIKPSTARQHLHRARKKLKGFRG